MAFNPDDFQFESIAPPEEHKPILEWNALARFIVLRTRGQNNEWEYFAAKLDPAVNSNLLTHCPDEWSNDNDRIINFAIYEDGEYILEKEKQKFDFVTKKSKWVRYEYKNLQLDEAKELFEVLKAAIEVNKLDQEVVRTREIADLATSSEYIVGIDEQTKQTKQILLNKSDWSQLADAQETYTGEIANWTTYRAYLRDNVRSSEDFDDVLDYLVWDAEFEWPIDPVAYHKLDPDGNAEYLSVPEHFSKTVTGTGKFASEALYGNIQAAAITMKSRLRNGGIPVTQRIWEKVQQYNLNDGLAGANLDNLTIVEE
jgi:hypothetical protein